jgi:oxygen-independent coproporphyrinogen-3 oxidase
LPETDNPANSRGAETRGIGLYIHVPFCLKKCPYCSFYSVAGQLDEGKRYTAAIQQQLNWFVGQISPGLQLRSIFFGGGTPSMLLPEVLAGILSDCLRHFPDQGELEISIEVNPATIDRSGLEKLRRAGFNRLSIGVQSFNDRELRRLGRPHSAAEAVQTVRQARKAGFANINLDLMYGLPDQELKSWQQSLEQGLELEPQHFSIYELTMEANTPFARQKEQGELVLPHEDTVLAMLEKTAQLVRAAGLERYEISNYARSGFQCRHNINYWQNGSYIGLGPGAVSCLAGTRYRAMADLNRFCALYGEEEQLPEERWQEIECLDREAAFRETVITGLRMTAGVLLDNLENRFGIELASYYGATLIRLIEQGLLEIVHGRLRLTGHGLLLANSVMAELV